MGADWNRLREIVEEALALDSSSRAAFCDDACGGDPDMRREVEALLAVRALRARSHPVPGGIETEILPDLREAPARPAAAALRIGGVVDGKYRIDGVLGIGGMGSVYSATHLQLERAVALKVIRTELLSDAVMVERFRREAIAVARLRHPNIVTVHDYGVTRDVGAYLVMELLEGYSLRWELAKRTRLEPAMALDFIGQACAAVGAAHLAGVVHRDIKPENIFLERRDAGTVVKVVDFGLAKLGTTFRSTGEFLTQGSDVLGTPGYISPEQCQGADADARSDVYALGCVMYEMLTGQPPFTGKTAWALVYQHVNDEPLRPSEVTPGLPRDLDDPIMRALEKSPSRRFQTAEAFARSLGAWPAQQARHVSVNTQPIEATIAGNGAPITVTRAMAGRTAASNLPHAVTRFVGRERQIDEVRHWLSKARLVTLVGAGGIGKTRLAIETASQVLHEYEDGVWVVELASLTDPALVARAIGSALGVRMQVGLTDEASVEAWLRERRVLLVLDNCEHLVGACARIVERLLGACAGLRVLATSQESLSIAGEAAWRVPSLALPEQTQGDGIECEAAQLFVDRATLANPHFELTDDIAPVVAEVCRRLEGIPLAIELAASRVRALTVEQILERLDDRLRLLAGPNRRLSQRQQTMRAALDWSYDLLTATERALLQRLSVFAGGWTLEAAEAVAEGRLTPSWPFEACANGGGSPGPPAPDDGVDDVLHTLSRLVDKSLVVTSGHRPRERYRMLEVVREYALERLRESGAEYDAARRHADVFLELADAARTEFVGPQEAEWLARLVEERANLRASLGWLHEHNVEEYVKLAAGLVDFWSLRGLFEEGLRWLTAAVEVCDSVPLVLRVRAFRAAGELAWRKGDLDVARGYLEESLELAKAAGDTWQIAWSTFHLALVLQQLGEPQASCGYLEMSMEHGRSLGDDRLVGNALNSLGEAARMQGDWSTARLYYERSLAIHRQMGHPVGMSLTLCNLGAVLCAAGDVEAARACYREALPSLRQLGNTMGESLAIDGLGLLSMKCHEWERAAQLAGAAAALRASVGGELEPADRSMRECYVEAARANMGDTAFETALAEGIANPHHRTIDDALAG